MLQLGFGLNPFQSGLVTFVAAVGALASKFVAQSVFRRFGFRTVLAAGALLSSAPDRRQRRSSRPRPPRR